MAQNTEIIALILAGGQGSRLKSLTKKLAKPAVPYGGKYRIIDFPLSNCSNSGIYTVGILTQYEPLALHSHIGIGQPWDLDRNNGGVKILPPFQSNEGGRWYKGTANAIFENIDYVDMYNPEYVLILSGDHIYKMDYSKMLDYHKDKEADITISVIEVPWEEASRFGILNTNPGGEIYEFDEKPKSPKSNLASMGIYIFKWSVLKKYLIKDSKDEHSSNDFGKNIIPKMLKDQMKMYAYTFEGYWKDVGTVESYWEANMDLLQKDNQLNLFENNFRIYSKNTNSPPQLVSEKAQVMNSLINEGCIVDGEVLNSILFSEVVVEEGAYVCDSVVFPKVVIKKGAKVYKSIIMSNCEIEENQVVGDKERKTIELVGNGDLGLGVEV
jgi:glucose-1-phosphate adenylyltransferase